MDKKHTFKIALLVLTVLFISPFISPSCRAENWMALGYYDFDYRVNNMPEDFRFVPIHKDDGYALEVNNGPISRIDYERKNSVTIEWAQSWKKGKFDLGIGFIWIWSSVGHLGNDARRNYTNHPGTDARGYGAALTFVSTEIRGLIPQTDTEFIDFLFNLTPKVFAKYTLDKKGNFVIGASLSYHQFNAINGWDRHDSFEVDDSKTLAHIYPLGLDITLHNWLTLGVSYNLHHLTSFGERADTEIDKRSYLIRLEGKF